MTSTLAPPDRRPVRMLIDVVLRSAVIVAGVAVTRAGYDETDPLAQGFVELFVVVSLTFGVALLDGMVQRDRARLIAVWSAVALVVALANVADYVRMQLSPPAEYTSLAQVLAESLGDISLFLVMVTSFVGAPAVGGIALGALIRSRRPTAQSPQPRPVSRQNPATGPRER